MHILCSTETGKNNNNNNIMAQPLQEKHAVSKINRLLARKSSTIIKQTNLPD